MTKQNSPLVLGTEPIGKLLTQYAIPAIIAMTASSLYNMADSIFIGHGVGALAISGLALTFPLMNLAAAFGSLVGVGASTLVAVKLGQKDYEGANNVLGNVLILNVVLGVAFTIAFLFLLDPVLYFFGASENTISYARDYIVWKCGHAYVFRLERCLALLGVPEDGDVCYVGIGRYQLRLESVVYLWLRMGHKRLGLGDGDLAGNLAYRTVDSFLETEATPSFQERYL